MKLYPCALALCLVAGAAHAAPQTDDMKPVDRSFVAKGDVTGDGAVATLTVHVTGASMKAPYKWNLVITDAHAKVLYRADRDDARLDSRFNDNGFQQGCADYVACKRMYYFENVPTSIFAVTKPSKTALPNEDVIFKGLPKVATEFLKGKGVPDARIAVAIGQMQSILGKPGYHELDVLISPVQGEMPRVWVPEVGMFVPFYQP